MTISSLGHKNRSKLCLVYDTITDDEPVTNGRMQSDFHGKKNENTGSVSSDRPTNNAVLDQSWLEHELRYLRIPFSRCSTADFTKRVSAEPSFFVIEILDYKQAFINDSVLKNISVQAIECIKDRRVTLVIYYPGEGDHVRYMYPGLRKVIEDCKALGIDPRLIRWVSGDLNFKQNLFNYIEQQKLEPIYPLPQIFSLTVWDIRLLMRNSNTQPWEARPLPQQRGTNDFINYNARPYPWRVYLVSELRRRGLAGKGLYSLGRRGGGPRDLSLPELVEPSSNVQAKEQSLRETLRELPIQLDIEVGENDPFDFSHMQTRHYRNTYFSLVSETLFESGDCQPLFITEKTFKPIMQRHPFIVVGCVGTLSELRRRGYKTFPELFDESYDDELCRKKRMEKILQSIESFVCKPPSEKFLLVRGVQEKIFHNFYLFLKELKASKIKEITSVFS